MLVSMLYPDRRQPPQRDKSDIPGSSGRKKLLPGRKKLLPSFHIPSPLLKPNSRSKIFGTPSEMPKVFFPEEHKPWRKRILDPGSDLVLKWNKIFLFSCLASLFIDPLYFFAPSIGGSKENVQCMKMDLKISIIVTCFRTVADMFYLLHMVIKFRMAYVAPSSRVSGRGELVTDPQKIAMRYLRSDFVINLAAALPLPQIVVWSVIREPRRFHSDHTINALALIVLFQYIPRLCQIFPLSSEIIKATGVVTKAAWAGAAYNLILYMLASHEAENHKPHFGDTDFCAFSAPSHYQISVSNIHGGVRKTVSHLRNFPLHLHMDGMVLGASWYLLSIERQTTCWKKECRPPCDFQFFNCDTSKERNWANNTHVFDKCVPCDPDDKCDQDKKLLFNYGIFADAITKEVVSSKFINKYLYCLWWGLQSLSSYGQNLDASTFVGDTLFAILISILGLVLFAHLMGNMQTYLQSITVRLEEWRLNRRDTELTEEWMRQRHLPTDLRGRVSRFLQYKWLATRGVDGESILRALPADLRRDIQRHLCLGLVQRVPLFSQMDDQVLDAICERLVSSLSTEGTFIVREGNPVTEMLFIIRGQLESSTTNGGRTGFFNSSILKPGDFCGEELLTWAVLPKSTLNLPSSTRTVKALVEVEAFALQAEELKFVVNQFRHLHSKKLQDTFRFYSQQWRTWAACFIQDAWRRFKRRKTEKKLTLQESHAFESHEDAAGSNEHEESHEASSENPQSEQNLGVTILY